MLYTKNDNQLTLFNEPNDHKLKKEPIKDVGVKPKKKRNIAKSECDNCKFNKTCDRENVKRNSVGMCCEFRHWLSP